jgi:hypothetical protein
MPVTRPDLKHWVVAFDKAALEFLAQHPGVSDPARYTWHLTPCAKHGESCVAVVYGVALEHFRWADEDPAALAERLLATMLPKRAGRATPPPP